MEQKLLRNDAQVKLVANEEDQSKVWNALQVSQTELLFIESNFISRVVAPDRLWQALAINTSLVSVDVSWNLLDELSVELLGRMLTTNRSIKTLDLTSSLGRYPSQAAESLGRALLVNTSLKGLHLGRNSWTDEHIYVFCNLGLQYNHTLEVLNLFRNELGDGGVDCLVQAVNRNHRLVQVDLVMNAEVSRRAVVNMEMALERNLLGHCLLELCLARRRSTSLWYKLPLDLVRLVGRLLGPTSHRQEDEESLFGEGFDVSSFDHNDCRREFESNNSMTL
ncbi:hypothetical protein BASA81_001872 [Batrachochytrium salamandrivorans]|nr:hypothetical protein BASA81_001872 [Batrachochytrium salamandrivorans]